MVVDIKERLVSYALPENILSELFGICEEQLKPPSKQGPPTSYVAGYATVQIKRLYTLWIRLEERRMTLIEVLHGTRGRGQDALRNERLRHIYITDALLNAVFMTLKYEIWDAFPDTAGREISLDHKWRVLYGNFEPLL
jgi:hypothetical protein